MVSPVPGAEPAVSYSASGKRAIIPSNDSAASVAPVVTDKFVGRYKKQVSYTKELRTVVMLLPVGDE